MLTSHSVIDYDKVQVLRAYIRRALHSCSQRGLLNCAKWLGEQLIGLPSSPILTNNSTTTIIIEDDTTVDSDTYLLAKSLFDLKEYDRCSHVVQSDATHSEKKSLFLRLYSMYLVCVVVVCGLLLFTY
jgi:anaphase-promoting complex subunit 8